MGAACQDRSRAIAEESKTWGKAIADRKITAQ
jgi:hypothetical protein